MLLNYLKIALRNLLRHKSFSFINIAGLSIGLITFLAISLYVVDEFSFDRFHEKKDRIYRAVISADFDGQVNKWGGAPNLLGPTAMKEIPEVEKATRVFHHNFGDLAFVATEAEKFSEKELFYADPEVFDVFTIPFIKGNKSNALTRPNTIVLSQSAASKYFGDADPIGKSLTVDNDKALEVTGVYQDFPANSFLRPQLIASFSSNWFGLDKNQNWGNASFDTFFLLHEGVSQQEVDKKIEAMLAKNIAKDNRWFAIALQPLLDIRLFSGDLNATFDRRPYGDFNQVKILMALALIVILIAAVNYMNLTTAQSQKRNKEVGIAKTLGATFGQLNLKFYFEASFFVFVSMLVSLAFFSFLLPIFNSLSAKSISMSFVSTGWFWLAFGIVWLFLTVLSGFYPAMYLSSFSPKSALQKTSSSGGQRTIRKGLVVFQFAVSIILIICSVVFYKQMNFIRSKKLGYQPEQVIAVMVTGAKDREQVLSLKTEYESNSDVVAVGRSQSYPGMGTSMRNIMRDGEDKGTSLLTTRSSSEILNVLGIKLLAGKTLPETKDAKDTTVQVVINKATSDYLQLTPEEVIGKRVSIQGFDGPTEVVGVTENFHITSLHQQIGAFCFHNARTEPFAYLLVKVNTGNLSATVKQLETIFHKTIPSAFEYTFLDQHLDNLYRTDRTLANVVLLFASLAIFVACLGLYALAAFTAEQRTKEIGIRKVMGASVSHLVLMLSKDFMILVGIAFVIGIPAGYYIMEQWLKDFAYKTDIDVMVFVFAGAASIVIAWFTVSFESYKAASNNPVKSLRSE
ncbi:MAG: ABC transporter permease [Cyclobacteriaceae bacterium]